MDKEQLLTYFQSHYLSKQEVLCKLPLNVPVDNFWPELLNRRKAGATLLALYDGSGMPYWFTLTDNMIRASERLSAYAMAQPPGFDPYRAEMTSAMTEEMFFTSFVEGAQIRLEDAMDFLSGGSEPETIQEQMIANNRKAWSTMVHTLFHPLDEQYIKGLAYMLTEDMDNCAEDYRQTDIHAIAAMNAEPYYLPPASVISSRMSDLYAFLARTDIHPLIKAAAGQAFILVTRPFPEGNERLSRMISSAVLLRSGYDFFRDISISGVLATESYKYYKAMCEILRRENGNDLTYFTEYYLGLLVRAIDVYHEREQRRRNEAIDRERELAKEPLKPTESPPKPSGSFAKSSPDNSAEYLKKLHSALSAYKAPELRKTKILENMKKFLSAGYLYVTKADWAKAGNCTVFAAETDLEFLVRKQLATRKFKHPRNIYEFTLSEEKPSSNVQEPTLQKPNSNKETTAEKTPYDRGNEAKRIVQSFIDDGIRSFKIADWRNRSTTRSESSLRREVRLAINLNLLTLENNIYTINANTESTPNLEQLSDKRRDFTLDLMRIFNTATFTISEATAKLKCPATTACYHFEQLTQRCILEKCGKAGTAYLYRFSPAVHAIFSASGIFGGSIEFKQNVPEQIAVEEQIV